MESSGSSAPLPEDPPPSGESSAAADRAEELIAACLERPEGEWEQALDQACQDHPELANALRRRWTFLERANLIESGPRSGSGDLPERLGDYQLLDEVGGGGMGVVFLAKRQGDEEPVALKLVRPDQLLFASARQRFQREVQAVSALSHPNIVSILDVGEERGIPFFAMEFVAGCTLAEVLQELEGSDPSELTGRDFWEALQRQGTPSKSSGIAVPKEFAGSWTQACAHVLQQVAEALHAAHQQGVLHRDVKPSNIMVTADGRAKLMDFGLAQSEGVSRMTRTGATVGSLPYMAPEQVSGGHRLDGRADVYSLGVTFFELLAFENPFHGANAHHVRQRILDGESPPLTRLHREVPVEAETVCAKAMEPRPTRRYPNADLMARDLGCIAGAAPIHARRRTWWLRTLRRAERHPVLAAAVLLLLLQGLIAQGLWMWNASSERLDALEARDAALAAQRETLALKEQTESALRESRRLLDLAQLFSLPRMAETLRAVDDSSVPTLEDWIENAQRVLEQRESVAKEFESRIRSAEQENSPQRAESLRIQWQQIEEQFRRLEAVLNGVEQDRDYASHVRWETLDSPKAQEAWLEACDEIFLLDVYQGLELTPQLGLLPLGQDPDSGLWEFWHVRSGKRPPLRERGNPYGGWTTDFASGITFVLLPGGVAFTQPETPRLPTADLQRRLEEGPIHVSLEPFFISKFELHSGQWRRMELEREPIFEVQKAAFLEAPLVPLTGVSWVQAEQWLVRNGLALPTDAQWEYACRGGTKTRFYTGNAPSSLYGFANFADQSTTLELRATRIHDGNWFDGFPQLAPVGEFPPNPFGLYDMAGNASEWCADSSGKGWVLAPQTGSGLRRAPKPGLQATVRGGSWQDTVERMSSGFRSDRSTLNGSEDVGVRPVRPLLP